jgi:gluconokinase
MAQHRLVVMGVAGCGKSALAAEIAAALACPMIEGDEHHLPASRDKMRQGIALTDSDREPWLDKLGALLRQAPGSTVLACSALKRRYRDRLRARVPGLRFVYQEISVDDARARVESRVGHFFPASVVASQFEALEPPLDESGVLVVDARLPVRSQCLTALEWLGSSEPRREAPLVLSRPNADGRRSPSLPAQPTSARRSRARARP